MFTWVSPRVEKWRWQCRGCELPDNPDGQEAGQALCLRRLGVTLVLLPVAADCPCFLRFPCLFGDLLVFPPSLARTPCWPILGFLHKYHRWYVCTSLRILSTFSHVERSLEPFAYCLFMSCDYFPIKFFFFPIDFQKLYKWNKLALCWQELHFLLASLSFVFLIFLIVLFCQAEIYFCFVKIINLSSGEGIQAFN